MARKRNRSTKPNAYNPYDPLQNVIRNTYSYRDHYFRYLMQIAMQMYEWKGLPDSVDPSYLERTLMTEGYVAFYKDPKIGYVVSKGTLGGKLNNYGLPVMFHAHEINYQRTFKLNHYLDFKLPNSGVLIKNNDLMYPVVIPMEMYARDLGELKDIIRINQYAQKTPVVIATNDKKILSATNFVQQVDSNMLNIFVDEDFNLEQIKVFNTQAPYVVDKLNEQKNAIWGEAMTYLGLDNSSITKKSRVQKAEVESNNEQIQASANVYLKSRQEAATIINHLYGLNVSVDFREGIEDLIQEKKEGEPDEPDNTIKANH